MSQCKIIRRVLVTHGIMSFDGSPMKITGKTWEIRECGTPIFGENSNKRKVCDSCLKGWTVKTNFMVDSPENKKLIEKEEKLLGI